MPFNLGYRLNFPGLRGKQIGQRVNELGIEAETVSRTRQPCDVSELLEKPIHTALGKVTNIRVLCAAFTWATARYDEAKIKKTYQSDSFVARAIVILMWPKSCLPVCSLSIRSIDA